MREHGGARQSNRRVQSDLEEMSERIEFLPSDCILAMVQADRNECGKEMRRNVCSAIAVLKVAFDASDRIATM